jgi:hypothetical protein
VEMSDINSNLCPDWDERMTWTKIFQLQLFEASQSSI